MSKQIYMIFYDRGYRAQDNAEHLCRWVMKNHPEVKTGYILDSDSYDWSRLKKEGFRLLDNKDTLATKKELLACDYLCSSIFNEGIKLNFDGCTCKRIFLNHGCFLAPISYLKNECDNIDLFIAANKLECDTMLDPYHKLQPSQVALCGQPRQDNLVKSQKAPHTEDSILIQFWQRPVKWTEDNNKKFIESNFYKKTKALLTNTRLLECCRRHKIKIIFKMHSIQYDWLQYYKDCENDVVRLSPLSELFEPQFIRSKMIVTDISSNAYEMAKIGKPCVYFEPDPEELFTWRFKKNGGFEFDLEKHSIGPIVKESVSDAVTVLCNLMRNNFELPEVYRKRRLEQISFLNDEHNCQRCFNAILKIKDSKTAKKTAATKKAAAEVKKKHDYVAGRTETFLYF